MERKFVGQADDHEATSTDTPGVDERDRLEGKPRAALDPETWGYSDPDDEPALAVGDDDDWRRDIFEDYLDEQAREAFDELFNGNLSLDSINAAFRVTVAEED